MTFEAWVEARPWLKAEKEFIDAAVAGGVCRKMELKRHGTMDVMSEDGYDSSLEGSGEPGSPIPRQISPDSPDLPIPRQVSAFSQRSSSARSLTRSQTSGSSDGCSALGSIPVECSSPSKHRLHRGAMWKKLETLIPGMNIRVWKSLDFHQRNALAARADSIRQKELEFSPHWPSVSLDLEECRPGDIGGNGCNARESLPIPVDRTFDARGFPKKAIFDATSIEKRPWTPRGPGKRPKTLGTPRDTGKTPATPRDPGEIPWTRPLLSLFLPILSHATNIMLARM